MAMTMAGSVTLPAGRQAVWAALNDPAVLQRAIPGCETLERAGEDAFAATAKMSIGPVKAKFSGRVQLSDIDPPNGYTISGEGQGGVAGFAKGGAKVRLEDRRRAERSCRTTSKRRSVARSPSSAARLINGVAKKYADEFFANFAKELQGESEPAT
jgi:carbon monoxide dehydrogenase subunit G